MNHVLIKKSLCLSSRVSSQVDSEST